MKKRAITATALVLGLALPWAAESQPIAPNVPIMTPPVPPSTVIRKFGENPALNAPLDAPRRPSPSRRTAAPNTPDPSPTIQTPPGSESSPAVDQRPLVCRTVGQMTVCE